MSASEIKLVLTPCLSLALQSDIFIEVSTSTTGLVTFSRSIYVRKKATEM